VRLEQGKSYFLSFGTERSHVHFKGKKESTQNQGKSSSLAPWLANHSCYQCLPIAVLLPPWNNHMFVNYIKLLLIFPLLLAKKTVHICLFVN
jgi:hypothetical protein